MVPPEPFAPLAHSLHNDWFTFSKTGSSLYAFSISSDWHGSAKPAGLPGKGQPGTGPGGNLCTLAKPVPLEWVAGLPACDLSQVVT